MRGSDILKRAGEALYGDRWQTPLSRDMGVTDRTMRNWASDRHDMPGDVPVRLLAMLRERGESVARLTKIIEQHIDGGGEAPNGGSKRKKD